MRASRGFFKGKPHFRTESLARQRFVNRLAARFGTGQVIRGGGGRQGMAGTDGILRAHLRRQSRPEAQAVVLPPPPPPTIERAAAAAAGRAAQILADLPLLCDSVAAGTCSLAELPELMPERALLAVIEAPGERLGVLALSPGAMAALIEMQAFGRVAQTTPEARKPTRADAALASDFINLLLEGLGQDAPRIPGEAGLTGFRYASHLEDARPLGLMLEDRGFRTLRLAVRLGRGTTRDGVIFLALPPPCALDARASDAAPQPAARSRSLAQPQAIPQALPVAVPAPPAPQPAASPRPSLAVAMRSAPVPLVAVLCRRRISLAELRALTPGATLALPRQALSEARLETASGALLAQGRLGEAEGFHALRLGDPQTVDAGRAIRFGTHSPAPAPTGTEPPMGDLAGPDDFRPTGGVSVAG